MQKENKKSPSASLYQEVIATLGKTNQLSPIDEEVFEMLKIPSKPVLLAHRILGSK